MIPQIELEEEVPQGGPASDVDLPIYCDAEVGLVKERGVTARFSRAARASITRRPRGKPIGTSSPLDHPNGAQAPAPGGAHAGGNRRRTVRHQASLADRDKGLPIPARRPAYSVLSNERIKRTFGVELPDWRSQQKAALGGEQPG